MTVPVKITGVLRPGLLDGVEVVLAGAGAPGSASTVGPALAELGAVVHECELVSSGEPEADDARVREALADPLSGSRGVQALVVDAAALFARESVRRVEGEDIEAVAKATHRAEARALIASLEATWRVTHAVANAAFIGPGTGGRIVYLAPPTPPVGGAAQDEHAEAARAGLENLARTLSIEWARYGIAPVSIALGPGTAAAASASVVAYLLSPAGAYFSGTELDLRGPAAPSRIGETGGRGVAIGGA